MNKEVLKYMKLKERIAKMNEERIEINNIQKSVAGLNVQIDKKNKQRDLIVSRQKNEIKDIQENYELTDLEIENLLEEKNDRIYNKIGRLVNTRWSLSIDEYEKVSIF